eukprot:30802-Pelagococcus_subviridis.AAC.9
MSAPRCAPSVATASSSRTFAAARSPSASASARVATATRPRDVATSASTPDARGCHTRSPCVPRPTWCVAVASVAFSSRSLRPKPHELFFGGGGVGCDASSAATLLACSMISVSASVVFPCSASNVAVFAWPATTFVSHELLELRDDEVLEKVDEPGEAQRELEVELNRLAEDGDPGVHVERRLRHREVRRDREVVDPQDRHRVERGPEAREVERDASDARLELVDHAEGLDRERDEPAGHLQRLRRAEHEKLRNLEQREDDVHRALDEILDEAQRLHRHLPRHVRRRLSGAHLKLLDARVLARERARFAPGGRVRHLEPPDVQLALARLVAQVRVRLDRPRDVLELDVLPRQRRLLRFNLQKRVGDFARHLRLGGGDDALVRRDRLLEPVDEHVQADERELDDLRQRHEHELQRHLDERLDERQYFVDDVHLDHEAEREPEGRSIRANVGVELKGVSWS